jgi:hypothetical protein
MKQLKLATALFFLSAPTVVLANSSVCPSIGSSVVCDEIITFKADGSITTVLTPDAGYDGHPSGDDQLFGVINNSGHTINSFFISNPGRDLFEFDGDGGQTYSKTFDTTPASVYKHYGVTFSQQWDAQGNPITVAGSGYEGTNVYFSKISPALDSGWVNFIGGLKNGSSAYFTLENTAEIDQGPIPTGAPGLVPEPPMLALLGLGLFAIKLARKKAF